MPQGHLRQALGGRRQTLARVRLGCLAVLGLLCGRGGGVSLAEGDPPAASASATSRRLLGSAITHAVVPMADGLVYGSVSPDATRVPRMLLLICRSDVKGRSRHFLW